MDKSPILLLCLWINVVIAMVKTDPELLNNPDVQKEINALKAYL